jgi:hypothetical protein
MHGAHYFFFKPLLQRNGLSIYRNTKNPHGECE